MLPSNAPLTIYQIRNLRKIPSPLILCIHRIKKETLSRLFFHYLSCTFLPLMWSMLMRNIWTALPEAATSSSTIFSVG